MFLLIKFVKNTKHSEKQGASKCDIILRRRCRGIRLYKKILSSPQSTTELNLNVSLSLDEKYDRHITFCLCVWSRLIHG